MEVGLALLVLTHHHSLQRATDNKENITQNF
jgi:hypothetical protein